MSQGRIHFGRLLVFLVIVSSALAQTHGRISGRVLDISGAAIPGAQITAESSNTGFQRQTSSDEHGNYSLTDIPIGGYRVTAQKDGFRTGVFASVLVGVGEAYLIDFVLLPGPVTEVIEVSARASNNISSGAQFENQHILDLPINGRDYGRFSLLAPGAVARSNLIADLTFNGLQTVHNQFAIDGIDASRVDQPYMANGLERGARLLTGSLDSIQEFRVQTAGYQAQYGRAAGAYVNIATKSGTNQIHGSVFEYFRNEAMDARNFFNTTPSPQAKFRFNNFGGNIGGPVRTNHTFFFINYEGSRQRIGTTGTGTTPSATLRSEVLKTSPELAPIITQFPLGTGPTQDPLVDIYTVVGTSKVREDTASIRIDHRFSDANTAFARVNINDSRVAGPLFAVNPSALGISDFQDVPVRTSNAVIRDQHVFNAHLLNEFSLGMQRWASQTIADEPYPLTTVSQLTISPGSRGRNHNVNTSYQIGDDMSYVRGAHTLKWGATAYRVQVDVRSSDLATLTYISLQDFIANSAFRGTFMVGNPGSATRAYQVGAYIQDTWQIQPRLTADYGLRYDFGTPPFDPANRAQTFDTRRGDLATPGTDYFRANTRNFGPRIGVAWQASRRWSFRSGYGVFWQAYPVGFGAYTVPLNNIPGNTTLLRQEIPALSYPLEPFLSQGPQPLPSVAGFDWIKRDTYVQQWNVTTVHGDPDRALIEIAYVGNHGLNLRRSLNINLLDPTTGLRPNPRFTDINLETNTGRNIYHALQVSVRRRIHSDFYLSLRYTWAHAIDDVQDSGLFATQPQSNDDFRAERGNGSSDVRHSFSYDFVWQLPMGRGKSLMSDIEGLADKFVSGWQLSGLVLLRSGVATTVFIGTNTSGTGNLINQRPAAVGGVSPYPRRRTVDQWLNPAAFSMPEVGTIGNLGRNTVFGPGLVQVDLALLKNTPISERIRSQLRLEMYNVLNHHNFAQPNTVLGNPAFGRILSTLGRTLGMGTSRQVQLAIRISF